MTAHDQSTQIIRIDAPHALVRMLQALRRDDYNMQEEVERIGHNAELTDMIMQEANSPQYRLHRPITRLQHAVSFLGARRVKRAIVRHLRKVLPDKDIPVTFADDIDWSRVLDDPPQMTRRPA